MTEPSETSFSDELVSLLGKAEGKPISLHSVEAALAKRGLAALILLMCLAFVQPIPLPGLSSVLGAAIIFLALRIMVGHKGKLPEFIGRREIDYGTFEKIVTGSVKLLKRGERLFRPRLRPLVVGSGMHVLIGLSICSSAIALGLPLPPVIPLTNTIPAVAIIFLALGLLEEDGVFVAAGHFVGICTWIYLFLWWELLVMAVKAVIQHFV